MYKLHPDVWEDCLLTGLGRYRSATGTAAFTTLLPCNGLCSALGRPQEPINSNTALAFLLSHLTTAFWSKRITRHGLSSGSQNNWLNFWHWSSLIQNRRWIFASLFLQLQNRGSATEARGLRNVYVIMLQRCSYYLEAPPLLPQVDEIQDSSDMLLQCCKWRRDSCPNGNFGRRLWLVPSGKMLTSLCEASAAWNLSEDHHLGRNSVC